MRKTLKCFPPCPYKGGKSRMADRVVDLIESVNYSVYAEPFFGMGGIFFRRKIKGAEFINDLNRDVWNLFQVLRTRYTEFIEFCQWSIASRMEYERLKKINPESLSEIERAYRFLYLQRLTFGGRVIGQSFAVSKDGHPCRFNIYEMEANLKNIHKRLVGVVIECLPYFEFIKRYDKDHTLFYLDPPYFGVENIYGKDLFFEEDFQKMADILKNINGKFIMSINDAPEIREIFKDFKIQEIDTIYSAAKNQNQNITELLICNFDLGGQGSFHF